MYTGEDGRAERSLNASEQVVGLLAPLEDHPAHQRNLSKKEHQEQKGAAAFFF